MFIRGSVLEGLQRIKMGRKPIHVIGLTHKESIVILGGGFIESQNNGAIIVFHGPSATGD